MEKPYRISDQNAIYFLTFTVVDWMDVSTRKEYKYEVVDCLNYCIANKGLEIYAWVLMTNHLHLLCRAVEPKRLSDIMRDFKKFVAYKVLISLEKESVESRKKWMLNQMEFRGMIVKGVEKYKFWKDGVYAIEIFSPKFFEQKLHYIHQNPVRAMIVEEAEHYLFSSARDYVGVKGLVRVSLY
ncbi:REP-associated tyrosine transposase [Litoribacter populi]|uniref:REP-associated tyrosine transposase n=1 Tax=Litoribacter populi TaxID=2598460 RepID=UPI00117C0679|nr:transposase [Litoribacter populi]